MNSRTENKRLEFVTTLISLTQTSHYPTIEGIEVYSLPKLFYHVITHIPDIREAALLPERGIDLHSHSQDHWYFTDGVFYFSLENDLLVKLSEYAVVHVNSGVLHGWNGVYAGKEIGRIHSFYYSGD